MKKNVLIRNLERLIQCGQEPVEPMSAWKWHRLYQLSQEYHIGGWVADGIRHYAGDLFLNIPSALHERFLALPAEKDADALQRFQLHVERHQSLRGRLSLRSLQTYATDFIATVKNIEE